MNPTNLVPRMTLIMVGWSMFLASILLPTHVSLGGLTDAGKPLSGFINLFYSFACIYAVFIEGINWSNTGRALDISLQASLGFFNLLMLICPTLLWFEGKKAVFARCLMIVAALYVCTIGFVVYRHFPLMYGHYVWRSSFVVIAIALNIKTKQEFY